MTREEKRIKLAEAIGAVRGSVLGYTCAQENELYLADEKGEYHDTKNWSSTYRCLRWWNPCEDLNACRDVAVRLTKRQKEFYVHSLHNGSNTIAIAAHHAAFAAPEEHVKSLLMAINITWKD